jgi:hypothetical protein
MSRQPLAITVLSIGGVAALMALIASAALLLTNMGVAINMRLVQFVFAVLAIVMLVAVRLAMAQFAHHAKQRVRPPCCSSASGDARASNRVARERQILAKRIVGRR